MYSQQLTHVPHFTPYPLGCDWLALRAQLMIQWKRLNARELDTVGPDVSRLAILIQQKYGIASELVENYLHNMARTLPAGTPSYAH